MNLHARFGGRRVRRAPISESAFLGAAVGAAMAGLRPVAELIMIDFLAVSADALVNHAAKVEAFSGGRWRVPMVVRAGCGGGYGDGGQHEQALWGWIAHVPGVKVVVPSTPADAGGLLTAAIADDGPVVFLEHKLLADDWLEYLGSGGRTTVAYDVPADGREGEVPDRWEPIPLGEAAVRRQGSDLTIAGVGVGIHRAAAAAEALSREGISASVLDLRSVAPLDRSSVASDVARTGRLLVGQPVKVPSPPGGDGCPKTRTGGGRASRPGRHSTSPHRRGSWESSGDARGEAEYSARHGHGIPKKRGPEPSTARPKARPSPWHLRP
jgi:pyruvate dehydrogenase E1 component beta subunit